MTWLVQPDGARSSGGTPPAVVVTLVLLIAPQLFKFGVYLLVPIGLVGAIVYNPDNLDAVIRNVCSAWCGDPLVGQSTLM